MAPFCGLVLLDGDPGHCLPAGHRCGLLHAQYQQQTYESMKPHAPHAELERGASPGWGDLEHSEA